MKKTITLLVMLFVSALQAQELESLLLSGNDASKLTENYMNPLMKGLLYSMNGGWYTTAKTHKKFGFDITVSANASFIPSSSQNFNFSPADYEFLTTANGETSLPTVMSENSSETTINVSIPIDGTNTFKVGSFQMPGGITEDLPINAAPAPMIQVGLGLPTRTDVKLRFVPKLSFDDDVEASLIGVGLQHDITQYLGPIDKLPLSVSVLAAFTRLKATYAINDDSLTDNVSIQNGEAEFTMNAFTIQALGSLDFKIITLYGGFGYNQGKSEVNLKGDYNLSYEVQDSSGNTISTVNETVSNPVNLDFEANGIRTTLGARLNLGPIKIFGDYTFQKFNTLSAGIAVSIR
ncbi:hypothetical protein H2O64_15520 [Kordia sp. YSTF-M3]|uniref:Outer membrane beta-barrel protein n=1 Tax=Kordia aestuariivivens TaxID=2759037 RepID=A0ABR7QBX9_9FLAO|nr:DUF6588 family protein [Kordia aestuariivivens]MBC8756086.1 hypothetical protein [Kordia aestuariivivens]